MNWSASPVYANMTPRLSDVETLSSLLTPQQFYLIYFYAAVFTMSLAAVGFGANVINIFVFLCMNRHDSVTVSFLGLSMSDLLVSLCNILFGAGAIVDSEEKLRGQYFPYMSPTVVGFFASTLCSMFYTTTILITLFISVARCMCVIRPLQFKHTFTVRRCVYFMSVCFLFSAANYSSVLSQMGVMTFSHPVTNRTRLIMWISPLRKVITGVVFTLTRSFIPLGVQVVLIGCVVIMMSALRKAAAFRQKSSFTNPEAVDDSKVKFARKESHVIRQVVMLSSVFLGCNFVSIFVTFIPFFQNDIGASKEFIYYRTYYVLQFVMTFFEQINSTVNILIYLRYNKRFKELFLETFSLGEAAITTKPSNGQEPDKSH